MSKNPASSLSRQQLVATLESSLGVEYLRGGTNESRLDSPWAAHPFTLVGQSPDGALVVELEGHRACRAPRGCGYIIPEGVRTRPRSNDGKLRQYHWSHLRLRVLGEVDLFHFITSPMVVQPTVGREIARINRALSRTQSPGETPLIRVIAERRRLCSELLALIVEVSTPRPGAWQTLAMISQLLPVLRFMRDQIGRPVLQSELTKLAGLSASRFHTVFRAATGLPPQRYLMNLRLRAAQEQLISTRIPVNEIAQAVGFRDAFHFSRMFKRASGMSPRAYRQRIVESVASH